MAKALTASTPMPPPPATPEPATTPTPEPERVAPQIFIRELRGVTHTLDVPADRDLNFATIHVCLEDKSGWHVEYPHAYLIYKGKRVGIGDDDQQTLADYDIPLGATLDLVTHLRGS